jgi:hypothetical protein
VTAQRLGQLQERKDSESQVIRKDIATLLQQGNVGLARAKAQNLIHEDAVGDLLEALEMHVGLIVEHFSEIKEKYVWNHLSLGDEFKLNLLKQWISKFHSCGGGI